MDILLLKKKRSVDRDSTGNARPRDWFAHDRQDWTADTGNVLARHTSPPALLSFAISLNFAHHTICFVSRKVDFRIARFLNDAPTRRIRLRGPTVAEITVSLRPHSVLVPSAVQRIENLLVSSDSVWETIAPSLSLLKTIEGGPTCGTSAFPKLSRPVEYS